MSTGPPEEGESSPRSQRQERIEALTPIPSTEFKRDLKRLAKRGKDRAKLQAVIEILCLRGELAARHRDHGLTGAWKGWRDCHIEPDWLLIYRENQGYLELARTGSHADLFE